MNACSATLCCCSLALALTLCQPLSLPRLTQAPTHFSQEYLPAQDAWVQRAPIALARLRSGAAYASGGVYAFGGVQRCTAPSAGAACAER